MSIGRNYRAVVDAGPAAVRTTRRAVAALLDDDTDAEVLDRVLLCTSELVTNALEHGGAPVEVRASVTGRVVRVEVTDRSAGQPHLQHPAPESIRGRGLLIVEQCADRWGVLGRGLAKTVWCEIAWAAP